MAFRMQALPQSQSRNDPARDIYLEYNFFDGVMVGCNDKGRSQSSPSSASSVPCDNSSVASSANECLGMPTGTGKKHVARNNTVNQKVLGDTLPRKTLFPNRKSPCMSSLGIHMCDCEDDSLDCNLVTCMASPVLDSRHLKTKHTSQVMKIPNVKDIKDNECTTLLWASGEKHDNPFSLMAETPSSSSNEGCRQNTIVSGSDFDGKSALAAWAALVSEAPHHSSMSLERISPQRTFRPAIDRKRVPTLASHLELTENAVSHSEFHHNFGENVDVYSPVPSTSLEMAASTLTYATLKKDFTVLKLDPGSLSVSDPAPYGTLHGLVHYTSRNSLPTYTLLLDDYEEVLTAKIWMKDATRQREQGSWRYSFYSLRGENKRNGKSGWKHWRKKDKLDAALLGKMKISSTLCMDKACASSIKSECILFSARLNEPEAETPVDAPNQAVSRTELFGCKDAACRVCSNSNTMPASPMPTSDMISHMLSPALQSSSPHKYLGLTFAQRSKQPTQKWSLGSGLLSMGNIKTRTKDASQNLGVSAINAESHVKEYLAEASLSSSNRRHAELAAIIVDVPLEIQSRSLGNEKVSITVILPSGNHGRPLCDLKGPSPLINRWKDGGKCDCKGWDLGCGLMVLSNSCQICKKSGANEGYKSQKNEDESEGRPLRLYKQDGDQDDAFLSLIPQGNGLVGLDFCAPLSPLQAFAAAVAILHGSDVNNVLDTSKHKLQGMADRMFQWDGLGVDKSNIEDVVNIFVNADEVSAQPRDKLEIPTGKVQGSKSVLHARASELALSFERV